MTTTSERGEWVCAMTVSDSGGVGASLEANVAVVIIVVSEGVDVEEASGGNCHSATTGGDKKPLHEHGEGAVFALTLTSVI